MALSVSEAAAETASTTNAASYAGTAFTPAAGERLIAFVIVSGNTAPASAMTGTWTWTPLQRLTFNTTDSIHIFEALATAATATTPTFATNNGNATGCCIDVIKFAGTNPQVKQSDAEARTGANPVITMPASLSTGNAYAAAFGMPRNPPGSTPPTSWTETADTGYTTPAAGFSCAFRNGGETGSTITFTSLSAAYGIAAVEVYEAPVVGTLTANLGAPTLTATGAALVEGDVSATVASPTVAATGAALVEADVNATIGAPTLTSNASIQTPAVTGTLSATMPTPTLSATGTAPVSASATPTLGAPTLSASGAALVEADVSAIIGAPTVVADAKALVEGDVSASIGAPTLSATGTAPVKADVNATIASPTLGATGGAPAVVGTLNGTLAAPVLTADGDVLIRGDVSSAIVAPTLDATATAPVDADVTSSIDVPTVIAAATAPVGTALASDVDAPTLDATGGGVPFGDVFADLSAALAAPTLMATGGLSVDVPLIRAYAVDTTPKSSATEPSTSAGGDITARARAEDTTPRSRAKEDIVSFSIRKGDREPSFTSTLFSGNRPINFTEAGITSVNFVMTLRGATTPKVDAAAVIADPANGKVRYDWGPDDTDATGNYDARWVLTYPGGNKRTIPADADPLRITVT